MDPRTGRPSALPSQTNAPNRRHEDDLGPLPEGKEGAVHKLRNVKNLVTGSSNNRH